MHECIIYFKGYKDVNGERINHLVANILNMSDLDEILEDAGLGIEDINVVDFR